MTSHRHEQWPTHVNENNGRINVLNNNNNSEATEDDNIHIYENDQFTASGSSDTYSTIIVDKELQQQKVSQPLRYSRPLNLRPHDSSSQALLLSDEVVKPANGYSIHPNERKHYRKKKWQRSEHSRNYCAWLIIVLLVAFLLGILYAFVLQPIFDRIMLQKRLKYSKFHGKSSTIATMAYDDVYAAIETTIGYGSSSTHKISKAPSSTVNKEFISTTINTDTVIAAIQNGYFHKVTPYSPKTSLFPLTTPTTDISFSDEDSDVENNNYNSKANIFDSTMPSEKINRSDKKTHSEPQSSTERLQYPSTTSQQPQSTTVLSRRQYPSTQYPPTRRQSTIFPTKPKSKDVEDKNDALNGRNLVEISGNFGTDSKLTSKRYELFTVTEAEQTTTSDNDETISAIEDHHSSGNHNDNGNSNFDVLQTSTLKYETLPSTINNKPITAKNSNLNGITTENKLKFSYKTLPHFPIRTTTTTTTSTTTNSTTTNPTTTTTTTKLLNTLPQIVHYNERRNDKSTNQNVFENDNEIQPVEISIEADDNIISISDSYEHLPNNNDIIDKSLVGSGVHEKSDDKNRRPAEPVWRRLPPNAIVEDRTPPPPPKLWMPFSISASVVTVKQPTFSYDEKPRALSKTKIRANERRKKAPIIVTALLDIGRGNWRHFTRHFETYLEYFEKLFALDNFMIIYCERKVVEFIHANVRFNLDRLQIIEIGLSDLPLYRYRQEIQDILDGEQENWSPAWDPQMRSHPEALYADYDILVNSKAYLLDNATKISKFGNNSNGVFVWIDAGYGHGSWTVIPKKLWNPQLPKGQITVFKLTTVLENVERYTLPIIYRKHKSVISGGFLAGDVAAISRFNMFFFKTFMDLLDGEQVDDDQTVLLMTIRNFRSTFNVLHGGWFDAFKLLP